MSSRLRGAVTLLLASTLCASCAVSSESTSTPRTVTETATATATAVPVTVTPSPVTTTVTGTPGQSPAVGALDSLPAKGRAPKTGFDRAEFGQPGSDATTSG